MDLPKLLAVSRGDEPADLLLQNAQLVNVRSVEIYEADVAICGNRIAGIAFADVQIGHGGTWRDLLRLTDPMLHVLRRVGETTGDDHAGGDSVEGRPDVARRGTHIA